MDAERATSGGSAVGSGSTKTPSVTVKVSAILAVVWGGLFAYEGFAGLLVPGQLFLLAALGLVLGAMLTVAVLWFGLRFAEVVVGGEVGKADARSASDRDQRDRGGPG